MTWDHDALLVPCVKGCGRKVTRNLDQDHGVCGACWEQTYGEKPR